jgi:D-alanyl-D-alanine carboxypeptidase/D-alanyl-D-alanine-endopeptidase (penicillin-binding protein 4)
MKKSFFILNGLFFSIFNRLILCGAFIAILLCACSSTRQLKKIVNKRFVQDSLIQTGQTGICIYEPATGKYWYQHHATENFVPASNMKLYTMFASLQYLKDSLAGMHYIENDSSILIAGTGDPTLLHPLYKHHPVLDFIQSTNKPIELVNNTPHFLPLGKGWSWDDYNEPFMVERSEIPVYGNCIKISFTNQHFTYVPEHSNAVFLHGGDWNNGNFKLQRDQALNFISILPADKPFTSATIPLTNIKTGELTTLKYAFGKDIKYAQVQRLPDSAHTIYSHPFDSVLIPMMYKSDNFLAEQLLLMTSEKKLGFLSDEIIIDSLLNNDFKFLPQTPRWVDGSGLSRYNLSSAQNFVALLQESIQQFGIERIKRILPSAGKGSLKDYFIHPTVQVFAKTGSMSNVFTLSGIMITAKGKVLLFSILNNHFNGTVASVRRKVEQLLLTIGEQY